MSKLFRGILIVFLAIFILPIILAWSVDFNDPTEPSSSYTNRTYIWINVTSSTVNTTNITTELYNSSGYYDNNTCTEVNICIFNFSELAEDTYYFNATAIDNEGNENSTQYSATRNVTIDLTYPAIEYNNSTDNGSITRQYIIMNVTANDTHLANITIYIYNSTADIINQTSAITQTNMYLNYSTNISDGETYYFNATACDMAGNCNNTETWNVTISINNAPYINITYPLNNSYSNESTVTLNVTAFDNDPDNITLWIYLDDILNSTLEINNTIENQTNDTIEYTLSNLSDGVHNWTAIANDGRDNSTYEYYYLTIDTLPPTIEIVSPENSTYNTTNILVNLSSSGADNVWFFNGTDNQTYNGTPIYIILNESNNTLYAYANDTAGNFNSTEVTFYINSTNNVPTIALHSPSPENNSYINSYNITLNFTVYDPDLDAMTVEIYGDDGLMISYYTVTNGTLITFPWTTTVEGLHNWTVIENDGTDNSTNEIYQFTIDTVAPTITFNSPTNNTNTNISNITFNISVMDAHLSNFTLSIYNLNGSSIYSVIDNISDSVTILNLSDGLYQYNATAYDILGHNTTTDTRNITINTTISVVEEPEEDDDGEPSGGGGGGNTYFPPITNSTRNTTEPSIKMYWSKLPAGNRVINNDKTDIPIDSLSILLNTEIVNRSSLELYIKNVNPFNEDIHTKIFKYILINTSINESYVDKLDIKFRVDKEWLEDNNVSIDDIILYEYDKSKPEWRQVNTSKIVEDESYAYYSSTSTQLVSFAIGQIEQLAIEPSIANTSNLSNPVQIVEKIGGDRITVNTAENSGILRDIGKGMVDVLNTTSAKISSITIPKDTQFIIIVVISCIMMLTIGIVTGLLIRRNIAAAKEAKRIKRESYKRAEKVLSYIEEPASTGRIVSTVSIAKKENEKPPLPSETYIKRINQLLLQCEYALDNGKVDDAKKHYTEAKEIYLHSHLNYEQKSKVYNKIIELSRRFK